MSEPAAEPRPLVDTCTPNVGRMYEAYLGGKDVFEADRAAAAKVIDACPETPLMALENRRFLGRAVRHLAGDHGFRQFIDLGTGLPSHGHVHHVLADLGLADEVRVVYVDDDPVAGTHAQALIAGANAVLLAEDLRQPARVLPAAQEGGHIDFSKPVAVLMFAVLHFVSDQDNPVGLVQAYMSATPPGSALAYSHLTDEFPERVGAAKALYANANHQLFPRSFEAIGELATGNGLRVMEPGIVRVTDWRAPDPLRPPARQMWLAGGVAFKTAHR